MLAGRGAGCCGFLRSFKGVRDVLAGREAGCCGFLRSFKGVRDQGVVDFFAVSRASVTCLLGVKHGVVDFFAVSRASVTCLQG